MRRFRFYVLRFSFCYVCQLFISFILSRVIYFLKGNMFLFCIQDLTTFSRITFSRIRFRPLKYMVVSREQTFRSKFSFWNSFLIWFRFKNPKIFCKFSGQIDFLPSVVKKILNFQFIQTYKKKTFPFAKKLVI
jgi:hypothetical protein